MTGPDLDVCRFGEDCAGQAGAEGRGICYADEQAARHAIGQLPRLYVDLRAEIGEPAGRGLDSVGGGHVQRVHSGTPLGAGEGYDVAAREIAWTLQAWAIPVWDLLHPAEADRGAHIERMTVPGAAWLLVEHFPVLRSLPVTPYWPYVRDGETGDSDEDDGPGAVVQLVRLYHRSRSILGETVRLEARALPCPQPVPPPDDDPDGEPGGGCGGEGTLARTVGKEGVRCRRCGWSCTEVEYELYALTFIPPSAWRRLERDR